MPKTHPKLLSHKSLGNCSRTLRMRPSYVAIWVRETKGLLNCDSRVTDMLARVLVWHAYLKVAVSRPASRLAACHLLSVVVWYQVQTDGYCIMGHADACTFSEMNWNSTTATAKLNMWCEHMQRGRNAVETLEMNELSQWNWLICTTGVSECGGCCWVEIELC